MRSLWAYFMLHNWHFWEGFIVICDLKKDRATETHKVNLMTSPIVNP